MASNTFKVTALSTGIAMALGTAPTTFAQEDQIEEIVVTGSHIRRTEYQGRAPIQIVDAEAIELIGAAQPVEVLKELTVNSGSDFYNETNDRAGSSQFNIRNLGLGSTLTLINGKRGGVAPVADDTGTDFLDINQFPLAMIERIEVLTNGASATYGSQAVAGVANIITRKGMEGLEISGGYSDSSQGLDAWHLNLAAGSQFDRGGFNIYATYYEQGHLERSEFDWMQDRLIGQGNIARSRFNSSTGAPGTYTRATIDPVTNEAESVAGAINNPDQNCEAAGGVIFDPADTGSSDSADICRYHFVDQVSVISGEERAQVFAEFDWEFSDNVKYYTEASFSNNVILRDGGGATLNTGRAAGGGFTIPDDHPFNFYVEDPADPTALIYIGPTAWDEATHGPDAATLRAVARPLGADVNNNELTQQIHREMRYARVLNGLEIDLPKDWYLDVSYMWASSQRTTDSPHNYRSNVFQDLVRSGEWNPFGSRLSDPTMVSPRDGVTLAGSGLLVQEKFDQRAVSTARVSEKVVDIVASGELFEMASGPVGAAIGAQFRDTELNDVPDSLEAAGEANEEGLSAAVRGRQDVLAFFAEAVVPIGDIGEVQLAVRNEDYGSGVSTTDPKISFEFGLGDNFGFRGSWGTSFQAPTVRQTSEASTSAFINDPASPGPGPNGAVCGDTGLNNNVTVTVLGAPDLAPQESENLNLGVIFQTERFRASVDYFNFDYTDLIAQSEGADAIVQNDCQTDGLTSSADGIPNDPRVIRDAGGQLRQVITQFTNIGSVETDGIDINATYDMDIGNGSLALDFGATFVNKFDVDVDGDGTQDFEGAGSRNRRNSFNTMPEWRTNLAGTYYTGNHVARLSLRYIDEYKNDNSGNAPVDSWTTVDAMYSYTFPGLIGDGDTTFTIGINNIADEDPPALTRCETVVNNQCTELVTRFRSNGTYNRGWIDRPGYDDRSGADIRGRIVYFRFKHAF
jgi:iron complex outermembrane receptor protein